MKKIKRDKGGTDEKGNSIFVGEYTYEWLHDDMKDKVNYRLLDNINKELIEQQLSLKEEAQIYETINKGASQINVNLFKW